MSWSVVVPLKRLPEAKSRLRPDFGNVTDLALAFAIDTVSATVACAAVGEVIVVTADERLAAATGALGARVVVDPGGGLNAAADAGIRTATHDAVAMLTGDLPALRSADLDDALRSAGRYRLAMVGDHTGVGTTLVTATEASVLRPSFGGPSRSRHEGAGHVVLELPEASPLRWDVDTAEDLAMVLAFGVGPATARAWAERARGR